MFLFVPFFIQIYPALLSFSIPNNFFTAYIHCKIQFEKITNDLVYGERK